MSKPWTTAEKARLIELVEEQSEPFNFGGKRMKRIFWVTISAMLYQEFGNYRTTTALKCRLGMIRKQQKKEQR